MCIKCALPVYRNGYTIKICTFTDTRSVHRIEEIVNIEGIVRMSVLLPVNTNWISLSVRFHPTWGNYATQSCAAMNITSLLYRWQAWWMSKSSSKKIHSWYGKIPRDTNLSLGILMNSIIFFSLFFSLAFCLISLSPPLSVFPCLPPSHALSPSLLSTLILLNILFQICFHNHVDILEHTFILPVTLSQILIHLHVHTTPYIVHTRHTILFGIVLCVITYIYLFCCTRAISNVSIIRPIWSLYFHFLFIVMILHFHFPVYIWLLKYFEKYFTIVTWLHCHNLHFRYICIIRFMLYLFINIFIVIKITVT